jgi:hypothetical protein
MHGPTHTYKLLGPLSYKYIILNNFETDKYMKQFI